MARAYKLDGHFTVLEKKTYPWPCAPNPKRTLELWPGDVLTKHPNGTLTKHNGLCMMNIRVPEGDLVEVPQNVRLSDCYAAPGGAQLEIEDELRTKD